jgi:hypothetical protein
MGPRTFFAAACAALLCGCATAPATPASALSSATAPADRAAPFVLGEALVKAEAPPVPAELERGADLSNLAVLTVEPAVLRYYLVRFARRADGALTPADEAFTRAALDALRRAPGVLACEPNALAQSNAR